jgi:hypothetical protein
MAVMPDRKLLSFDIELSDVFDLKPGEDLEKYGPFHISVASTAIDGGEERLWYSTSREGKPATNMDCATAARLLAYLQEKQRQGHMVCAWNGLSFDLRWIGHVAGAGELAAEIALDSFDPMFQFFNQRGFPVGLGKVAQAMGVRGKTIMTGADAPRQWQAGNHESVMAYVMDDARMTNAVVKLILEKKQLRWVTQRGTASSEPMPVLKPVRQVLRDPRPDQSWMSDPIPREKFHRWLPPATLQRLNRSAP